MRAKWLCVIAITLGFLTEGLVAGQPAQVGVEVQTDQPTDPPAQVVTAIAQRWVAYEVEEPVTLMRKVRKWKLEDYEVQLPAPGPQPADVVLCEPTVNCVPTGTVVQNVQPMEPYVGRTSTSVDVNANVGPVCRDGRCSLVPRGNVDVNVDVGRRRGLFWRFRR